MAIRRIEPGPGQESVWDYPRPPAVEPTNQRIRVVHAGVVVADSHAAIRVLETSQPPAYYLPPGDVTPGALHASPYRTVCEWKGLTSYWSVRVGEVEIADAAWSYEDPTLRFASIRGYVAFYAQRLDECWVDDERVEANPGAFYGGWITSHVVGPFKGAPGTMFW